MNNLLLIGVGNEFRSDDALGILVAREVRRRHQGEFRILEADSDGASLLSAWEGARNLLLVDAASGGGPPGSVLRIDASEQKLPVNLLQAGSHTFGVSEAIAMAMEMHSLPHRTILFGVVGESFELGCGLSDRVLKSIPDLLQIIEEEIRAVIEAGPRRFRPN
jgi:hydrogenase maturation protease